MVHKVCDTAIRESHNIESPLLWIERSQFRLLSHVSKMSQERFTKQTLYVKVNEKKPVGRPRSR